MHFAESILRFLMEQHTLQMHDVRQPLFDQVNGFMMENAMYLFGLCALFVGLLLYRRKRRSKIVQETHTIGRYEQRGESFDRITEFHVRRRRG